MPPPIARPRIARPGEPQARPIPLVCPLCAEALGAIVLDDPKLRYIHVEVQCLNVEPGAAAGAAALIGHRELHIQTLDLAKKQEAAPDARH